MQKQPDDGELREMILSILLPTYNRQSDLKKNLVMLCDYIHRAAATEKIGIIVSDNCSTDQTEAVVKEIIEENCDILIDYRKNETNLGISNNLINIVYACSTEFGMYLGDDDYIQYEYLLQVLEQLETGNAGCIIPSYYNIDLNGKRTGRERDLNVESRLYESGFFNCLNNSWRAHQMSGLVFRIAPAQLAFRASNIQNCYPQILAVSCSCMTGKTYHLTDYPVAVTRPNQAKKDWGYGKYGRIPDIFENYIALPGVTLAQREKLERKIIFTQYWRIAMYLKVGIVDFFTCISGIQHSPNTTKRTAVLLPVLVIASFIKNGFELLFQGKLLSAFRTKVDIKT